MKGRLITCVRCHASFDSAGKSADVSFWEDGNAGEISHSFCAKCVPVLMVALDAALSEPDQTSAVQAGQRSVVTRVKEILAKDESVRRGHIETNGERLLELLQKAFLP